ncbi:hypothetical protein EXM69_16955 [Clostridium botulinum]|uniref:Uncharacterized protein n=1 Tax=Clostridium botulinum TaxID=1491 RepID=A0A846I0U5_CLOBO|nr:hypothetical protein [Clostridium botulinum]
MSNLSAIEMAGLAGEYWGKNDGKGFGNLFSEDAIIDHPFFTKGVSPNTVIDVLNCTVCGTTVYDGCKLINGTGDGIDDLIEMKFIDSGENSGYTPQYAGRMVIEATIKNHKFTKFEVPGYELIQYNPTSERELKEVDIGDIDTKELVKLVGQAWANNNMGLFLSLFSEKGIIYHPLFKTPITPIIAADVLNSAMNGVSIPHKPKILKGDGSGVNDTVDMYFDETGDELGYLPDNMGIMHITAKIENHKFVEFLVHGYTPTKSIFKNNTSESLKEVQEKEYAAIAGNTNKQESQHLYK